MIGVRTTGLTTPAPKTGLIQIVARTFAIVEPKIERQLLIGHPMLRMAIPPGRRPPRLCTPQIPTMNMTSPRPLATRA